VKLPPATAASGCAAPVRRLDRPAAATLLLDPGRRAAHGVVMARADILSSIETLE